MVLRKLHFASSVLLHCLKKKSAISCALCVIKITRKNICFILRNRAHLKSKAKMSPTSGDWAWKPSVAVELTQMSESAGRVLRVDRWLTGLKSQSKPG